MKLLLMIGAMFATAPAQQFDLICSGKVQDAMTAREKPIRRVYHIDLATNRYCYNECSVRPLAEVHPDQIVFEQTKARHSGDSSASLDFVSRTTGKWSFYTSYWSGDGVCEAAPFSGFPEVKQKF